MHMYSYNVPVNANLHRLCNGDKTVLYCTFHAYAHVLVYSFGSLLLNSNIVLNTRCNETRYSYILLQIKSNYIITYYTMYKGTSLGNNITVTSSNALL